MLRRLIGWLVQIIGWFRSPQAKLYGDARWANASEARELLKSRNKGLLLAPGKRLSQQDSFMHLLLVAPTRMGKSSTFCIPNLLEAEGSCITTDPSGELYRTTAGHLAERGFDIRVLAPADPNRSLSFNPLAYWQTPQELRELATILGTNRGAGDPFWTTSGINLLSVLLSATVNLDTVYQNLANVRWLLNHMADSEVMHPFMAEHLAPHDPRVFAEYKAFVAQDPKVSASVISTARSFLDLWSDEEICRLTAQDSIDIRTLRRQRTAVYLIVPEHQVRYFGVLMNLFYSACLKECLSIPTAADEPVYFLLDEFGNMGRINNFASTITTLGKRRCSVSLLLQDLAQLTTVYGASEARTIIGGGCGNKLFYPGLDLETSRYVEGLLGTNTMFSTPDGSFSDYANPVRTSLMQADQVRRMERNQAIFISGRSRPVLLSSVRPYFGHGRWREMVKPRFSFPKSTVEPVGLYALHKRSV